MDDRKDLYRVTKRWVEEFSDGHFEKLEEMRNEFGDLEIKVFGDIGQRCRDSLALKYDAVRNALITYYHTKSPEHLESLKKKFSQLPSPEVQEWQK